MRPLRFPLRSLRLRFLREHLNRKDRKGFRKGRKENYSLQLLRRMLEYSAPAQIADAVNNPMPSQNGPSSTCPSPNSAM